MVRPIKYVSLSSKFRKAEIKKRNMVNEMPEGDIWIEILLEQLTPSLEISTKVQSENQLGSEDMKFSLEADLARLLFSYDNKINF